MILIDKFKKNRW